MGEELITLIAQTFAADALKQRIPMETQRDVWCRIESVSRAEWRDAGVQGLKPELKAVMPGINYGGELIALYSGTRYAIYRTYRAADSDEIELYLSREVGA